MKDPHARFYSVDSLFGMSKNEETLKAAKGWLDRVETAKLSRVPAMTNAMGKDAVLAVERAAEVRSAAVADKIKTVGLKVPVGALFAEGSVDANNVMTQ
jgi:hypothetical protein